MNKHIVVEIKLWMCSYGKICILDMLPVTFSRRWGIRMESCGPLMRKSRLRF